MAVERTLSIIKPDAVARNLIGQIVSRFENAGLIIMASRMAHLNKGEAEGFYAEHRGKPFFEDLVDYMTSGPVVLQVLEGDDAIMRISPLVLLLVVLGGNQDGKTLTIWRERGRIHVEAWHGNGTDGSTRRQLHQLQPLQAILTPKNGQSAAVTRRDEVSCVPKFRRVLGCDCFLLSMKLDNLSVFSSSEQGIVG